MLGIGHQAWAEVIGPFVKKLSKRSSLSLTIDLSNYVIYTNGHQERNPKLDRTKSYTVQAHFDGKAVSDLEANLGKQSRVRETIGLE